MIFSLVFKFNDLLLYLTPVQQGLYRINHELPLTGMRVAIPQQQDYQNEFSIISVARSFTLAARYFLYYNFLLFKNNVAFSQINENMH